MQMDKPRLSASGSTSALQGGITGALGVQPETKPGLLRGSIASCSLERERSERRQVPGSLLPRKPFQQLCPGVWSPEPPHLHPHSPPGTVPTGSSSSGAGTGGAAAAGGFSPPRFKLLFNPAPSQAVGRGNGAAGHPEQQRWLLQPPSTSGLTPRESDCRQELLQALVIWVINNPWPGLEPPPLTAPF